VHADPLDGTDHHAVLADHRGLAGHRATAQTEAQSAA
jgi:hypothetical protein